MAKPLTRRPRGITVPIHNEDLSSEWPAFDSAFGRFIREFGRTESALGLILELFAAGLLKRGELATDILRALIGSRRTPELAKATMLCLNAAIYAGTEHSEEDIQPVKAAFSHLAEIRFLRDRTAHYAIGAVRRGGEIYFTVIDRWTVTDIDKAEKILFRIQHLENATADLKDLRDRVEGILFKAIGRARGVSQAPWLYKPSELIRLPYPDLPSPPPPSPPPQS